MTWFRNTRYGSLSGSHAQITHMMWRQSVHVIQKSGMQDTLWTSDTIEELKIREEFGCFCFSICFSLCFCFCFCF